MAATYSTVRYKDTGDNVKALQNALNTAGYKLDVDGVFGENTLNAVKSYQKANGLEVDGIVGDNTWGALNSAAQGEQINEQSADSPEGHESSISDALENLIAQYNAASSYTPMTDDEIREQAESEYQSYYDQLELAATQQHQQSDLALQQQRDGLQNTYDKQRENSSREYANGYSKADRQMLSRGMQRSSYGAQALANISSQAAEAQQAIGDQQAAAEANVDQQRTQLSQQLAKQLQQYRTSEAADVMARVRALEDQEYERGRINTEYQNSLAAQIYQFMRQEEQDQISQQQWQQQFDESVRQFDTSRAKKPSSGGGSGKTPPQTPAQEPSGMTLVQFMNSLGGGAAQPSQSTSSGTSGALPSTLNSAVSNITNTVSNSARKKKPTATAGGGKPWTAQTR